MTRIVKMSKQEGVEAVIRQGRILGEVIDETGRQEQLVREGRFEWTLAMPGVANEKRLAVLAEEVGEAAKEVTELLIAGDKGHATAGTLLRLRAELVQVAACAVSWIEGIDGDALQVLLRHGERIDPADVGRILGEEVEDDA